MDAGSFISFFPESKMLCCEDKLCHAIHSRLSGMEIPSCNFYGAYFCESTLYIAIYGTDKVLSISMKTYDTKEIHIKGYAINNMTVLNDEIWVTCTNSHKIVRINALRYETEYELVSKIKCDISWRFFVPFQDGLLLLPDQGEEIWIYNNIKDK